jgi:hypothetical protein
MKIVQILNFGHFLKDKKSDFKKFHIWKAWDYTNCSNFEFWTFSKNQNIFKFYNYYFWKNVHYLKSLDFKKCLVLFKTNIKNI